MLLPFLTSYLTQYLLAEFSKGKLCVQNKLLARNCEHSHLHIINRHTLCALDKGACPVTNQGT